MDPGKPSAAVRFRLAGPDSKYHRPGQEYFPLRRSTIPSGCASSEPQVPVDILRPCGCRSCSYARCGMTRPTPRSTATGFSSAPASSAGWRAASTRGCRSGTGAAKSLRSSVRRWTPPAPGALAADHPAARAVGTQQPQRHLRPRVVPLTRPQGNLVLPLAHGGGGRDNPRRPGVQLVPRPAAEPVPDQLEVPRRAAAALRRAARPRVPHEGRVLLRPGRRRPARVLPDHVRVLRTDLRPVRPRLRDGGGRPRDDRRRREPRVHGRGRRGRGPVRALRERGLRSQHASGGAAHPPTEESRRQATSPPWRRCTLPTCPASTASPPSSGFLPASCSSRSPSTSTARSGSRWCPATARSTRTCSKRPSRHAPFGCSTITISNSIPSCPRATSARISPTCRWSSPTGSCAPGSRGSPARTSPTTTSAAPSSIATSTSTSGPASRRSSRAIRARVAARRSRSTGASRSGRCSSSVPSTPKPSTACTPTREASSIRW